jgi:hypothetical protein
MVQPRSCRRFRAPLGEAEGDGFGGSEMSDTNLQIAKQQVSEQRMRVLNQQGRVLGLRREGGQRLEEAVGLLNSMRDELHGLESRLEQLIINS